MNKTVVRSAVAALTVLMALTGLVILEGRTSAGENRQTGDNGESIPELWKKVEAAGKEGLPQTAVEHLKKIVSIARAKELFPDALKALTYQAVLETAVKGNKPEEKVKLFKDEIDKSPAAMRPMMKLVLAQWYWHYFSRNRWRFLNRAATQGMDDADFTTWDLPRLYREIDSLYGDALKDEDLLKKTSLSAFKDFLEGASQEPSLRPTLFDFAAFEALDFYTSGEQAAALPEDAFEIDAQSPALAGASDFLKYRIETTDLDSPKLRAILLFQKVLDFHRDDAEKDVFLDADIRRLRYVRNAAVGEGASDRYTRRLEEIADAHPSSPEASLALYYWAQETYDGGDFVKAHQLALRGGKLHPGSAGAANCEVLRSRITAKDFNVRAESVLRPGLPAKLAVKYRNIRELHFRLLAEDFEACLTDPEGGTMAWLSERRIRKLLARQPDAAWMSSLKPTEDFKETTALINIRPLEPGFYRLIASSNADFSEKAGKLQYASFWVSGLGLVSTGGSAVPGGYVVRNDSGEPVASAEVTLHEWSYRDNAYIKKASALTDDVGAFEFKTGMSPEYGSQRLLVVRRKGEILLSETDPPSYYPHEDQRRTQTVFFTDRSIYRPGQTVFFKGLCLDVDRPNDNYNPLSGRRVRIYFRDANRQEIASLDAVSNDFGSFSGSFTAPTDRLTGEMTISSENPRGGCSIRVEEYKRPKFLVKLDVPDKEFRLNDGISIDGEAVAYTGAPIDAAAVKFRVIREARCPWRRFYWPQETQRRGSREIAHGVLATDERGKFSIAFKAVPDLSLPAVSGAVFTYSVFADVTDGAGETRSASGQVRAGYTALEADLQADEWQSEDKPVALTITTKTLNGKRAAAKGVIEIYSLRGPRSPVPQDLIGEEETRGRGASADGREHGETPDWRIWPEDKLVGKRDFSTSIKEDEACVLSVSLKAGAYRARLKTKDKFGAEIEAMRDILVLDPGDSRFALKIPFHGAFRTTRAEVGETFEALWGTGYERGPVLVEILQNNRLLRRYWTPKDITQGTVKIAVEENLRGGFTVILSMVKENRLYRMDRRVFVPWTSKLLSLQWQSFRSKLQPGQGEKWTVKIQGPRAAVKAAEMVATLYDASLDQFRGHAFPAVSGVFRGDWTNRTAEYSNKPLELRTFRDYLIPSPGFVALKYPRFPGYITEDRYGYGFPARTGGVVFKENITADMAEAPPSPLSAQAGGQKTEGGVVGGVLGGIAEEVKGGAPEDKTPEIDLSKVQARKNLDETAFFFPHLLSDKNGIVSIDFTMPEALTEWRFLGLAHTRDLESGPLEGRAVTQKDLMVQPNPPRFLREGDNLEFTVKVTNMTAKEAEGSVELTFFDPQTEKSLDADLHNEARKRSFAIPAGESRSFAWPIQVPDGAGVLAFKAVGATPEFQDGEEGMFPVLSRRLLVRESIPLWISGKGEKSFTFEKLVKSAGSATLRHTGLTLQIASNPAWYAVQALPFLMEYPYECSEQVFNRLYADSLAQKIANSDPKIRRIFDLWKGTDALKSNLEKNEDLKSVLLQESPWVLEAKNETQAKHNIGLLFDDNRMTREIKAAGFKIETMQLPDGSWPWFPGGPGNSYITLYITAGFGRLKHLGVAGVSQSPAFKALGCLDKWIEDVHAEIIKHGNPGQNHLSPTVALYLYGRSFFLSEKPLSAAARTSVDYFLKQAARYWLDLDHRQSQAQLALSLRRFGDKATAAKIMRSMKERSQVDEEMGRYWSELELSWWWFRAPIETQAVMIEAFDEVMDDAKAVEECKIWLLKQKQTQDWRTTKATADAVYGLLRRGDNLLASDALVEVALGGRKIEPEKVEAGTGFYEKRFEPAAVRPEMGRIAVRKADAGIAWGGLHWQYMEDISEITPSARNPLRLKKGVFVQRLTKKGPVIEPVGKPLAVGDTLIVRIELRADRDMEYVHMRDHRGSGLEPVNVLSRYKQQGGLVYYESTKDTATHFFIDYLPKGTHVFEYPLRVVHRGSYQNGMAHIECMYAPEFNSHSESVGLEVR